MAAVLERPDQRDTAKGQPVAEGVFRRRVVPPLLRPALQRDMSPAPNLVPDSAGGRRRDLDVRTRYPGDVRRESTHLDSVEGETGLPWTEAGIEATVAQLASRCCVPKN